MKTSSHHCTVHLNSRVFTDTDVWMAKVLTSTKYLRESLTNLSELSRLIEIEPKSTKHIEFVQKEGQNDGKDRMKQKITMGFCEKTVLTASIEKMLLNMLVAWLS